MFSRVLLPLSSVILSNEDVEVDERTSHDLDATTGGTESFAGYPAWNGGDRFVWKWHDSVSASGNKKVKLHH